jgi:predicted kinase
VGTGKLLIFRGLPASGKSTVAKGMVYDNPEGIVRVNRDDLRKMLHDGKYIQGSKNNPGTERTVIEMEHAMVRRGLRAGLTVIDDNTNLPNRNVKALVEIAEPLGAEWQIVDFTDVPLQTCLDRNMIRNAQRRDMVDGPAQLDGKVIGDLFNKFVSGKPYPLPFEYTPKPELTVEKYVPDTSKPKAVIVDIDGTVALMNGKRGPHDYHKVSVDDPNWPVINLVKTLQASGNEILFTSGRKDSCRDDTVAWLKEWIFPSGNFKLIMRETADNRPDYVVKTELFNRFIRNDFNVQVVLDDRDQVVQGWRNLGLTCLQVADGNF